MSISDLVNSETMASQWTRLMHVRGIKLSESHLRVRQWIQRLHCNNHDRQTQAESHKHGRHHQDETQPSAEGGRYGRSLRKNSGNPVQFCQDCFHNREPPRPRNQSLICPPVQVIFRFSEIVRKHR
jgi:hypothetical protein